MAKPNGEKAITKTSKPIIKSRRLAPLIKKVTSSNLVNTSSEFRLLNIVP